MAKPPYKQHPRKKRNFKKDDRPQEYRPRKLNRGAHFTVYDIQGSNISPALVAQIENAIEQIVVGSGIPSIGIDVRRG